MTETTMSPVIAHRYDFVYLFDVTDGNPNGDPDAGNQPRIDPETGHGLITDVCLKRKVRNFVSLAQRDGENNPLAGYDVYVKERGILANEQKRAYHSLNIEPGDRPNEQARKWMCKTYFDIRAFGAVMTTGKTDEAEAGGKRPRGKPTKGDGAEAPADAESATNVESPAKAAGKPKTRQWNCGQVRGPVQLTFARSVVPILSLEHAITRCALTNVGDTGRESSGEEGEKASSGQMGRKMTVPYGLYMARGFVSPHLAADTLFSEADLALLWQALCRMFEFDRSATRGQMIARGLHVFKHGSKLGNAPAHKLQELVTVTAIPKDPTGIIRSFSDFTVSLPGAGQLPKGVQLLTFDCDTFADKPVVVSAGAVS